MLGRIGTAVVLALLVGAVPTIVSLCELRCVALEATPPENADSTACAGHGAKRQGQPPQSEHQDCGGHVLLAKGGASRIALQLDLAVVAALPSCSFVLGLDQKPERLIFESADLSPPSRPSFDLLRL